MIAPAMVGNAALLARLAALPDRLRAALVSEAEGLGRALRRRVGRLAAAESLSLAVESTAAAITVTIATRPGLAMRSRRVLEPKTSRVSIRPRRVRPHGLRRAIAARPVAPDLDAAFVAMGPAIRAGLKMAVRQALVR